MSKTKQQDMMIGLLVNISYRTEVLNNLDRKEKIEVSTSIESYERIVKQRLSILGRTYGNKKKQAEDRELHNQLISIRQSIYNIINK